MPFRRAHIGYRLDNTIFRFEIAAKARREITDCSVAFEQLLRAGARTSLPRANFAGPARCLGHEGLGRFQTKSTFLVELFFARLDHLVVGRFLDSVLNEVLAEILFVLDSRRAMSRGRRDDVPFFYDLGVGVGFLRRVGGQGAPQFSPSLVPVRIREFIRVALGDERNFAGALLDFIGRRRAETVAVHRNFACRMRVVVHMNKYEANMAAVRIELFIIRLAAVKGNLVFFVS